MKGKLYGIGVGPGDSELMTVKAARIVGEADIIITPKTEKKDGSVALDIASPYIQEHTEIVPVVFPMVLNDATQEEGWQEAKRIILSYLDQGKSVVFLTLGDPMFYSTYMYVYRLIENTDHEIDAVMISRVGLPDEQVFVGLDKMPKDTKLNYLSTILAKRKDR